MKTMDLMEVIPFSIGLIGSLILVVGPFTRKYRHAPIGIRLALFLAAPLILGWSTIGFFLALHQKGTGIHTDLPWAQFWALDHLKGTLGGVGVGLLLALVINPEFYRSRRRSRANGPQHPA